MVYFSEEDFIKKTNEEESDWSDIQAAIDALHSTTDEQESWRDNLEAHFNVRAYLKAPCRQSDHAKLGYLWCDDPQLLPLR